MSLKEDLTPENLKSHHKKKMPKFISDPTGDELGDLQLCDLLEHFLAELGAVQSAITLTGARINSLADMSVIPRASVPSAIAVQKQVLQLQQHFQQIIKLLTEAVLEEDIQGDQEQRLRPYQTEAHRLLRLMAVAALKLRTAKQPETFEQQRSLIETQLDQLRPFAQAIADEVCGAVDVAS